MMTESSFGTRSGPSMSMIDSKSNIGVGNYKGVMLCNRPFGGTAGNQSSVDRSRLNCVSYALVLFGLVISH